MSATRFERLGALFQFSMLAAFMAQHALFSGQLPSDYSILAVPEYLGVAMFVYCLWVLYIRRARLKGLITSGLFAYTRHPMYLGLFTMHVFHWAPADVWTSPGFLGLESVFIVGLVVAGYLQEKETLARFGQEAVDYYARTPRIPFTRW